VRQIQSNQYRPCGPPRRIKPRLREQLQLQYFETEFFAKATRSSLHVSFQQASSSATLLSISTRNNKWPPVKVCE
jgi:hypothetical protein